MSKFVCMGFVLLLSACASLRQSTVEQTVAPETPTMVLAQPDRTRTQIRSIPVIDEPKNLLPPTPTSTLVPPSATPYPTPAALTKEAITTCPVSLPNLAESPDPYYISVESGFGNPQRTMFIGLWPGGVVFFQPNSAGRIYPNGSLEMKFWFYRTIEGDVVIGGRRLDAPAPSMPEDILKGKEDGYDETGFEPAGLLFPTEGCWEVTASIGEEKMIFVTLVVKFSFDRLWLNLLPEGITGDSYDVSGYPYAIRYVYSYSSGDEIVLEISQAEMGYANLYPKTEQKIWGRVIDQPATCVQGAWDAQGEWRTAIDRTALFWAANGIQYQLSQTGLGQSCDDLLGFIAPPN